MTDSPERDPSYRIQQGDFKRPWRDLRLPHSRSGDEIVITGSSTVEIRGNFDWGLLLLKTDTGLEGIGEVYRGDPALGMAEELCELVVGEDPRDVGRLVSLLKRNSMDTSLGQIGHAAITGIETALLDLKGKALGVPVYDLLGGKYRNEVRVYCDVHAGESLGEADETSVATTYAPEAYAAAARETLDEGFDVLKVDLDVPTPDYDHPDAIARRMDNHELDHKVEIVETIRDEIGSGVDLGVDLHFTFTMETAIRFCERLDRFDLAWIEDPVPSNQKTAHERVVSAVRTPILTGENLVGLSEFLPFVRDGGMDIAAPDVAKAGGLRAFMSIARICEEYGIPLAPHNIGSPVGTIAGVHACAATENVLSIEYHASDVPWWGDMVNRTDTTDEILDDGTIRVPESPGLGIELNWEVIEEYRKN